MSPRTNARWTKNEIDTLMSEVNKYKSRKSIPWKRIARKLHGRSNTACSQKYADLTKKGSMSIQTPGLDKFQSRIMDKDENLNEQLNENILSYLNRALVSNKSVGRFEDTNLMNDMLETAAKDVSSMLDNAVRNVRDTIPAKAVSARA
jgi:hypothetical protein